MAEPLTIHTPIRPRLIRMRYVMTALGCLATFIAFKPQFFLFPWKFTIWEFRVLLPLALLYYLAFLVIPIPFATWAQQRSVKRIILWTMTANIISTYLSEFAILYNALNKVMAFNLVFVVELTKDMLYPVMGFMISKWSPPNERSFIVSITYSGGVLGAIFVKIGLHISGRARLWITALLGIIWCIAWSVVVTSSPSQQKSRMSEDEKKYIRDSLGIEYGDQVAKNVRFPFKKIFISPAFISLAIVHICVSFVCIALTLIEYRIVQEPLNGSLPIAKFFPLHHVVTVVFSISLGGVMSLLLQKKLITITKSRKIATFISLFVPLLCLILTVCIKDMSAVSILIMIGFVFSGAKYSGTVVNIIDLAPNFSGILLAIFTTIETLLIILQSCMAEHLSHLMLQGKYTNILIRLMALVGLMTLAMMFYWLCGSAEQQRWHGREGLVCVNYTERPVSAGDPKNEEQNLLNS